MKKVNTSLILFILLAVTIFSSCNVSLNILNRKYRPGYTINFSNNNDYKSNQLNEQEKTKVEREYDSVVTENCYDNITASLNNSELFINNYSIPDYIMPCDTPPKKNIAEPWSLYTEKEPNGGGQSKWKVMEPFNLASFFIFLVGIILASLLNELAVGILIGVFGTILIFSIISLIRIKKNPKKYSVISKIFDWSFVGIGIGLAAIFLLVLMLIAFG